MRTLQILSVAGALTTLLTAMQGRLARVAGASMACPDWPLCEGSLIPRFDALILVEWTHRFFALATAVIVVGLVVVAWRQGTFARVWSLVCLASLVVTAGIGGFAVTNNMDIPPIFSAIDQGSAMLTFGSVVALVVWSRSASLGWNPPHARTVGPRSGSEP